MKKYGLTKAASYTGYIVQAIVNNFLPLLYVIFNAGPYNISVERLGSLSLINFSLQLAVDLLSVYLIPRFGYKKCVVAAQGLSALGFLLLGFLPDVMPAYPAIMIAMVCLALGSGLIEVIVSPIIEALPNDNKSGSMSLLHSFYSWGQVLVVAVTTLLLLAVGRVHWQWISFLWFLVPAVNTVLFYRAEILQLPAEADAHKGTALLKDRALWLFLLIILCAGASEISMVQWSSFFVETGFGLPKWLGDLLGPCMFAVLMGFGRVLFGLFGDRIRLERVILAAGVLCLACYITVAFSTSTVLSLVACALCGFSVSVMWPGTYSLAAVHYRGGTTQMFSFLAMAGDLGCGIGPWLLAFSSGRLAQTGLADRFAKAIGVPGERAGMQLGFFVTAVFPFIMIISALVFHAKKKAKV